MRYRAAGETGSNPLQEMGIEAAQVPLASVKSVETTTQAVQAILEGKLCYYWKVQ